MSTTMIAIGHMAVLVTPLDYEAESDALEQKGLYLNYDGTLVYSKTTNVESCEFDGLHVVPEDGAEAFMLASAKAWIHVTPSTIKPFFCHWYTGSDSPLATITKEEFLGS